MSYHNILTVDVEEWYQTRSGGSRVSRDDWDGFCDSGILAMPGMLSMLGAAGVHATFFVLGYNARKHPDLIRAIASEGHEIALHGYFHDSVTGQSPDLFVKETKEAKNILEDLAGQPVKGFRAPNWSVTQNSLWALECLLQLGFRYDASMDAGVYKKISSKIPSTIMEIPRSSFDFFGVQVPFGGGFYLRAFPYALTKALMKRLNRKGRGGVVYVHPWEFAEGKPPVGLSFKEKLVLSWRLPSTKRVLSSLLRDFKFSTIRDAYLLKS